MISSWIVYWIATLDSIISFLSIFVSLTGTLSVIFSVIYFVTRSLLEEGQEYRKDIRIGWINTSKNLLKITIPICIFSSILCVFVPNTKQAVAIYFIPKVANNQHVQQIPEKLCTVIEKYLDIKIKDFENTVTPQKEENK